MACEGDVLRVAQAHATAYRRCDVLVIAAGVGTAGPLDTASLSRFDKQFAVNVRAPYALVQALLPILRATAAQHPTRGAKIIALVDHWGLPGAGTGRLRRRQGRTHYILPVDQRRALHRRHHGHRDLPRLRRHRHDRLGARPHRPQRNDQHRRRQFGPALPPVLRGLKGVRRREPTAAIPTRRAGAFIAQVGQGRQVSADGSRRAR